MVLVSFIFFKLQSILLFSIKLSNIVPSLSSPTIPNNETCIPNLLKLIATFAAPPGRSSVFFTLMTGTGASGEIRSVSPKR